MKKLTLLLALTSAFAIGASDPAGIAYWSSATLQGYKGELASKVNERKIATVQLGNFGNHSAMMAHREGSGQAELHAKVADLMVIQSGHATLVVGGKMVGGQSTAPGEMRGPSISGGEKKELGPGDIVHIPANTPHQLLLTPGAQITYFVMKVTEG